MGPEVAAEAGEAPAGCQVLCGSHHSFVPWHLGPSVCGVGWGGEGRLCAASALAALCGSPPCTEPLLGAPRGALSS